MQELVLFSALSYHVKMHTLFENNIHFEGSSLKNIADLFSTLCPNKHLKKHNSIQSKFELCILLTFKAYLESSSRNEKIPAKRWFSHLNKDFYFRYGIIHSFNISSLFTFGINSHVVWVVLAIYKVTQACRDPGSNPARSNNLSFDKWIILSFQIIQNTAQVKDHLK